MTEYSIDWCNAALDQINGHTEITKLLDDAAIKSTVEIKLTEVDPQWFVHYDHGSEYVMWGDDEQHLINLSNLDRLAGMHVYCMNCSSGQGLGAHAISLGILEYLGYMDVVSFTTNAAEEFKEALNYGLVKAITEGRFLKDVVEDMRGNGYDIASQLVLDGRIFAAAALVRDMNILHVFYEGGPEPPDPTCFISRILLRLFGWNGLLFFRKWRQKLFPEPHPRRS